MSDKQYVVTPEMVYGAEWIARHADELERWEWGFRAAACSETFLPVDPSWRPIPGQQHGHPAKPRIILLRRKTPSAPQLRDVYGRDTVYIDAHYEWAKEFRPSLDDDIYVTQHERIRRGRSGDTPHLILRDRTPPTRVWFKAEEKRRRAHAGEWVWFSPQGWLQVPLDWTDSEKLTGADYLCATRHEDPDLTPTVVTQADVDREWAKQHGGGE